jgi:nucleoside-diphosphate-sugar epimerase
MQSKSYINPGAKVMKKIVVAGATGKLGKLIIEALLNHPGVQVRALVRDAKKVEALALKELGAELFELNLASSTEEQKRQAADGAFTVISAMQGGPDVIIDAQLSLLKAAKAAGAKRFIPSDYSYNIFSLPKGVNINSDWRRGLADLADKERSEGFEVVHVMQGIFTDKYVLGFLGLFDEQARVMRYWGDGKTPIDWTTWEDTARFTAAAAIDEAKVPAHLFVAGDRIDVLTFAKTWESIKGEKLTVERLGSLEELNAELQKRLSQDPQNMYAWLPLMYARGVFEGQALLGPLQNGRFPTIKAETVAQAITRGVV